MTEIRQAIPRYGRDLLKTLDPSLFENAVVFYAPEAWEIVADQFPDFPMWEGAPGSMEEERLERQIGTLPAADCYFGIGGGSACDAAKMAAWKRHGRLILMPSIVSVDAAYTSAIGVRVRNKVRYVGEVYPDELLIDFNLLEKAPKQLNRAGIGDILSIYTALYDWKLAHEETGEAYHSETAERSHALLMRLVNGATDINACSETGLRLISDLYVAEVALCEQYGNSRPEEGSEHYFAYCLEAITKRSFIHGDLIAMAVLLTSICQGQDVTLVKKWLDAFGVNYRPESVGVSEEEILTTLIRLPEYLEFESQLPYGIYHHRNMSESEAGDILKTFKEILA